MALTFDLTLSAVAADCAFQKIKDETVYGGAEPARNTRGNYLLVKKMDINGQVVSDETPDQTIDFLTIAEWQFDTDNDGWYQFILLSVPIWNNSDTYEPESVAGANDDDIVYYDANKEFYRALQSNTNQVPTLGGDANWQVIADFNSIVDNTGDVDPMDTHYHDDYVSCRLEDQFTVSLEDAIPSIINKGNQGFKEVERYEQLGVLLDGSLSLNFADRMGETEEVARFVEDKYLVN